MAGCGQLAARYVVFCCYGEPACWRARKDTGAWPVMAPHLLPLRPSPASRLQIGSQNPPRPPWYSPAIAREGSHPGSGASKGVECSDHGDAQIRHQEAEQAPVVSQARASWNRLPMAAAPAASSVSLSSWRRRAYRQMALNVRAVTSNAMP